MRIVLGSECFQDKRPIFVLNDFGTNAQPAMKKVHRVLPVTIDLLHIGGPQDVYQAKRPKNILGEQWFDAECNDSLFCSQAESWGRLLSIAGFHQSMKSAHSH